MRRVRALRSRAQRSHTRGHRPCMALHLRERNEFGGHMLAVAALVRYTVGFLDQGAHRVHRSGIAHRAWQAAREPGWPEAVGHGLQPDRSGAVLALVAGDLARTWRKQRRNRGPSSRNGAVLQTRIKASTWKP